jgi:hypothetical protein
VIGGMALIIWNFLKPRYGYLMENVTVTGSAENSESTEKTESSQEDKGA